MSVAARGSGGVAVSVSVPRACFQHIVVKWKHFKSGILPCALDAKILTKLRAVWANATKSTRRLWFKYDDDKFQQNLHRKIQAKSVFCAHILGIRRKTPAALT
jgi:hypothetical protein